MSLVGAIILLVLGIAVVVGARHYITEPVIRVVLVVIGAVMVVAGGIGLLLELLALAGINGGGPVTIDD